MKILLLTDSLGLPRNKPEICAFEDTWPFLLKNTFPSTHQVSIGAATSQVLLRQITYQKAFNPDLVVLQVGIVDCAPRFMSRKELDFSYALGNLGKGIRFILNRRWIKQLRKISYLKEIEFKHNIVNIKNAFDCPIIAIGILPATNEYEMILPGVTNKIISFNRILQQEFVHFIDTDKIIEINGTMSDHHHLNKYGHIYIFHKLKKFIKSFNKEIKN